jgi:hypothetical protein
MKADDYAQMSAQLGVVQGRCTELLQELKSTKSERDAANTRRLALEGQRDALESERGALQVKVHELTAALDFSCETEPQQAEQFAYLKTLVRRAATFLDAHGDLGHPIAVAGRALAIELHRGLAQMQKTSGEGSGGAADRKQADAASSDVAVSTPSEPSPFPPLRDAEDVFDEAFQNWEEEGGEDHPLSEYVAEAIEIDRLELRVALAASPEPATPGLRAALEAVLPVAKLRLALWSIGPDDDYEQMEMYQNEKSAVDQAHAALAAGKGEPEPCAECGGSQIVADVDPEGQSRVIGAKECPECEGEEER